MKKDSFIDFYNKVVKTLGTRLVEDYSNFYFCDNPNSLYEEYLNQKQILRVLYEKNGVDKSLLDRHKVCACMTVAIIKVRLLSTDIKTDKDYCFSQASKVNEQLAFMSAWELFLGFIRLHKSTNDVEYNLPQTFHNPSFMDTITRSLFLSNQLNSLSTPMMANIFFLLEKYCEKQGA